MSTIAACRWWETAAECLVVVHATEQAAGTGELTPMLCRLWRLVDQQKQQQQGVVPQWTGLMALRGGQRNRSQEEGHSLERE